MKDYRINILILTISIAFTACTGNVADKPDANAIVANGSSEINSINDATIPDSITTSTVELTKIYTQAIADYIKEVYKKDKTVFDTLFLGKRNYGQPDDFPNIEFPDIQIG